jgi:outer membrane receptor protein involved in Fe transport
MSSHPLIVSWRHSLATIAASSLALVTNAQLAAPPAATDQNNPSARPVVVGKADSASPQPVAASAGDETITLSPFVVTAEEDDSYRATDTLAGTRLRTRLEDVGSAIQVITQKFLQDTGATNSESLLVLTTGTETASTRGNMSNISASDRDANETPALTRVNTSTRVRGLGSADNTRDFFLTDIPWDSYNTGRVDLQRGPNSILFGLGNPSGIVNASLNTATFKNSGRVEVRVGSYGSFRGSVDINRVLLKNELAIRVSSLFDRTEFQQRPAFSEDRRAYAALRWDPAFLSKNGTHFSFKANYEAGHVDQNRARVTPPIDRITPWFNTNPVTIPANPVAGTPERTFPAMNRSTYNLYTAYRTYDPNIPGTGAVGSGSSPLVTIGGVSVRNLNFQPGISEIYTDGAAIYFPDPTIATQQSGVPAIISESNRTDQFGLGANGLIDQSVSGIPFARIIGLTEPWKLAQFYGKPFYGAYISNSLTDPSIFDFYHKLIDGENKPSTRAFRSFNLDASETFFDNRAGISVVYNNERYRDRTDSLFTDRYQAINVDVNATLMDGSPNPNVGRPFISARSTGNGFGVHTARESFRAQAFAELRASDFMGRSLLTSLIGRHVITGVYSTDQYSSDRRSWARLLLDQGWPVQTQGINSVGSRALQIYQYLGPSMLNVTSPAGLNLDGISSVISPTTTQVRYFDSRWQPSVNPATTGYVNPSATWVDPFNGATRTQSENPANYGGWKNYQAQVLNSVNDGPDALTTSATLQRNKLSTKAVNWQGYLWENTFIPLFGWRRDTNRVFTTSGVNTPFGITQVNDPAYAYAAAPRAVQTTETKSWGGVLHMPPFMRGKLPWGTTISLTYNRSSNFNPSDVGRVDMLNRPLAPSRGQSKDYGFVISTLDDKLTLRVNRFETAVVGSTFDWSAPMGWLFDDEARGWKMANQLKAGLTDPALATNLGYNYFEVVNGVNTITPASRARQQLDVDNYFKGVPTELFAAGGIPNPPPETWLVTGLALGDVFRTPYGQRPPGYTATRDTLSKGLEFELTFRPVRNWNIAANASKTEASTTNNVGSLAAWLEVRDAFWNGPAGDMLLFSKNLTTAQPSTTMRADWNNNVGYNYAFQKYTNGANVQELAKWRFNLTTSYTFTDGFLKNVKVGGSYRYSEKAALGYRWTYLTVAGKQVEVPDITQPIYGKDTRHVDLMVGYSRKLSKNLGWEVQLNVRNALGKNELVPVTVQPDGTYAAYRIVEGPSWTITNSLRF